MCTLVLGFCLCTFYFSLSFSQVTELWRFPTPLLPLSLSEASTANQHIQIDFANSYTWPNLKPCHMTHKEKWKVQFLSMPSACSLILNNHFKATLTALSLSSLLMSHERCCSSEVLKCIIEKIWSRARRRWPHFCMVSLGLSAHSTHTQLQSTFKPANVSLAKFTK